MDAPNVRIAILAVFLLSSSEVSRAAQFRTRNFVVNASTEDEARIVAEAAEEYRQQLAEYWTGRSLPNWKHPCQVTVESGNYGASGKTTFQFVGTEVVNWRMVVRGTPERILDSVLPHEVNHTIFACYFRRPLPRWADEGAATLWEHPSEQRLQLELLQSIIDSPRELIPLKQLLSMREYPRGHRPMLIMYAEGFAMVDFLIQQKGRETYLRFLADGHRNGWEAAIQQHYNHDGIDVLQQDWQAWVKAGMPRYGSPSELTVAEVLASDRGAARPVTDTNRTIESSRASAGTALPVSRSDERVDEEKGQRPLGPETSRSYVPNHTKYSRIRQAAVTAPVPDADRDLRTLQARGSGDGGSVPPRRYESKLEMTNHRFDESRRRKSSEGVPWERSSETGSTPQWADFPGQAGSF